MIIIKNNYIANEKIIKLGGEIMEATIKKILAIDREADEYRKNMEQDLLNRKKELDDYLKTMDKEYTAETEKMKQDIRESKMEEAAKVSEEIKTARSAETDRLNNLYKANKDSIVNEIFQYVISSCKEG